MMVAGLCLLVRLLELGPVEASLIGARLAGVPGLASELLDICEAESLCAPIGIHRPHAGRKRGEVFWRAAVEAGWLSACDGHGLGDGNRWGVRGTHGLVAAYSVRWLGECVDPAVLDVPIISAVVTAKRLGELRTRYGLKTAEARALAWRVGVGGARHARLAQ